MSLLEPYEETYRWAGNAMILIDYLDDEGHTNGTTALGDLASSQATEDQSGCGGKQHREKLIVRLEIFPSKRWITRLVIKIKACFLDAQGVYRESEIEAIFDVTNLSKSQDVICKAVHNLSEEERKQIEQLWNISLEEDRFARCIREGRLTSLHLCLVNKGRGCNLFSRSTFGVFDNLITAFRQKLRRGQQTQEIHLLFDASVPPSGVSEINTNLHAAFTSDPICSWWSNLTNRDLDSFLVKKGASVLPTGLYPATCVPPQYTFPTLAHYIIVMLYAAKEEWDATAKSDQSSGSLSMRVIGHESEDDKGIIGVIDWDVHIDDCPRPKEEEHVTIEIDVPTESGGTERQSRLATVIDGPHYVQSWQVCVSISLSLHHPNAGPDKDIPDSKSKLQAQIDASKFDNVSLSKACDILRAVKPLSVEVTAINDEHELVRRNEALGSLCSRLQNTSGNLSPEEVEYYVRLVQILLGNDISTLPPTSLFNSLKISDPVTLKASISETLSDEQAGIIEMVDNAPGGVTLLNAAPGTGKTFTAMILLTAIAIEEPVMILTNINALVDHHCRLLTKLKNDWIRRYYPKGTKKPVWVVRVHYDFTEKQILLSDMVNHTSRHKLSTLKDEELLECNSKFKGVRDKRVQIPYASMGWHMARIAGLITDGNLKPLPGAQVDQYTLFRVVYQKHVKREAMSKNERKLLDESIDALRIEVLKQASIVCTTTSNASQQSLHKHFRPVAVVIDEAAKISEPDALHAFVWYPSVRTFLLVGDTRQLGPFLPNDMKKYTFGSQMELPLLKRLKKCGVQTHTILVQKRFCEGINVIVSSLFYNNELVASDAIDPTEIIKAQEAHERMFGQRCNAVWVDVASKARRVGSSSSSYNSEEIDAVCRVLQSYLNHGYSAKDIGIITGYNKQFKKIREAVKQLEKEKKLGLSELKVGKFNEMVGDERSILIVSMVITNSCGFLDDDRRINAAISRARYGLCVVGYRAGILGLPGVEKMGLGKLPGKISCVYLDDGKIPD